MFAGDFFADQVQRYRVSPHKPRIDHVAQALISREYLREVMAQHLREWLRFHQLEAYALFVSGYLMAVAAFKRASALRTPVDTGKMHRWRMAAVFRWLDDNGPRYAYAGHVLAASRARFFKVARMRKKSALLIGLAAAVVAAAVAWSFGPVVARYMPKSGIVLVAVSVLIAVATADALIRSVRFEERRQGDTPDETHGLDLRLARCVGAIRPAVGRMCASARFPLEPDSTRLRRSSISETRRRGHGERPR
ncbi:MAG TPA: hypothetical protein VGR43_02270 [Dehalococcoidia bacterium]|jgi:hypothetical protein|nr:hypothetical protein [Dehalococcoidia bacterium]